MTTTAWILLTGYLATARRLVHDRTTDNDAGVNDVGSSTLELVILVLGLIGVAALLVAAITAAVRRRVDQIN